MSAKNVLIERRDAALDRMHRLPQGWTRDILIMTAEIAQRVATFPANNDEERQALDAAQMHAAIVCGRLLEAAQTCATLEGIEPND